jgi:tRNA pseudouridine38-40 synthase
MPTVIAPGAHAVSHWAALLAYDGTDFAGFQRQSAEKGRTVQGVVEQALERITGGPAPIVGAGRTDAGVHATGQVIGFASGARLDGDAWRRALNAHLPQDVAVRAVCGVTSEFHARKSALARRYCYRILVDPVRAPLAERYAWRVPRPLDVDTMDAAAALLLGEHDFGAFGTSPRDQPAQGYRGHTVRTMLEARCIRLDLTEAALATGEDAAVPRIELRFAANAFLTGMVRRLVGTLALVGEGRLSVEDFRRVLQARTKAHQGTAAPARGLCLAQVDYPLGLVIW